MRKAIEVHALGGQVLDANVVRAAHPVVEAAQSSFSLRRTMNGAAAPALAFIALSISEYVPPLTQRENTLTTAAAGVTLGQRHPRDFE
jgi:hypothetical protein